MKALEKAIASSNQTKQVVKALTNYAMQDEHTASRRIHIHMFHSPVEILADESGNVRALKTERTRLVGDGSVEGTGQFVETPVQAVYRAIGYFSSPIEGVPFDFKRGVIPNAGGRVLGEDGEPLTGIYATGWVKRGPVGLIGSTKSDAQETIGNLVADAQAGKLHATSDAVGHEAIVQLLTERGVPFTTWEGWELLNAYEEQLGAAYGEVEGGRGPRERIKVVSRKAMTAISLGESVEGLDLIGQPGE